MEAPRPRAASAMVERRMQCLEVGCNENDVEWDMYQLCEVMIVESSKLSNLCNIIHAAHLGERLFARLTPPYFVEPEISGDIMLIHKLRK